MPDAPVVFNDNPPPDGLKGMRPPIAVSPASVSFQPSPSGAKPRFSSHIGSNHQNGAWTSATAISSIGLVIPAAFHSAAAASRPACGLTWSRPEYASGSVRSAVAWIHATGWPSATRASAAASSPITSAHAPSEEGHVSSKRMGSHSICDDSTFSSVMSGWCRWANGFLAPLSRSLTATIAPMCAGAPERRMYARTCGAKYPPAPAPTGLVNGTGMLNAHMAFDSDCFSPAIASTRRYLPDCTRLAATTPVDPPTEPAVCTRISGLPGGPTGAG